MTHKRDQRKREQARKTLAGRAIPKRERSSPTPNPLEVRRVADAACAEARSTVTRLLGDQDGPARPARLADAAREVVLRVIQQSPQAPAHACRPGCAFCCHTAVTVAPPEVLAILEYLRQNYAAPELTEVQRRLNENADTASRMTHREYTAAAVRCALLSDDGNCRVHPVRPLACAGFLSVSREACEAEFLRQPNRPPVPLDRRAMFGVLGVSYGLKEACQGAGLDGASYELHHALRRIWNNPDAPGDWAKGDALFGDCIRADQW